MTHYLLSVYVGTDDPQPAEDTLQEMYAAVDVFNKELQDSGAWVFAGGLHPIDSATVVDGRGETPITTDGPFLETKEYLGGFWVVQADDLDTAVDLARRGSTACRGPVEVRPFEADV